mmetsp:Transcript_1583/g.3459  ORF Transcript_1583/g.3459 Transcript_1583/m.3459 type:complete len:203 (+) Transcript_1583:181-789(+)
MDGDLVEPASEIVIDRSHYSVMISNTLQTYQYLPNSNDTPLPLQPHHIAHVPSHQQQSSSSPTIAHRPSPQVARSYRTTPRSTTSAHHSSSSQAIVPPPPCSYHPPKSSIVSPECLLTLLHRGSWHTHHLRQCPRWKSGGKMLVWTDWRRDKSVCRMISRKVRAFATESARRIHRCSIRPSRMAHPSIYLLRNRLHLSNLYS